VDVRRISRRGVPCPVDEGHPPTPQHPQIGVSELPVEIAVHYLSGGGAAKLPVTLRAQFNPKSIAPPEEFDGFAFANGAVKEGIVRRGAGTV
jgi:hypothetical protein